MAQTPALKHSSGMAIDYTPNAAVVGGDVVVIGTIPMIAPVDIAASELGTLESDGIWDVPKTTDTYSAGDAVYWDADGDPVDGTVGTGAADSSAATGNLMGVCVKDAATGDKYVRTKLTAAKRTATIAGSVTADDITGSDSSLGIAGLAAAQGGAIAVAGGTSSTGGNAGGAVTVAGGTGGAAGAGGAASMVGGVPASGNAAGGTGTFSGGAGSGTGAGGAVTTKGGASGSGATGNGGAWSGGGGAAASTNGTGGAASLTGGVATGTGTGGAATITSGASAGAGGTAGAVTIDCGSAAGGTAGAMSVGASNASRVTLGMIAVKTIDTPVAAAGAGGGVAGAAALGAANFVAISSDGATKGVKLLTSVAGDWKIIINTSGTAANLFAASGGTINGGAGDAGCAIPASKGVIAISTGADTWIVSDLTARAGAAA